MNANYINALQHLAQSLGGTKFDCADLNTKLLLEEITFQEACIMLKNKLGMKP